MLKRSLIISSSLALSLMGTAFNTAHAEEPQLNQDRLQQQIRDRATSQANPPGTGQQMRQEQQEHTHQNRIETRSDNRQDNRQGHRGTDMVQGDGFGGAGGAGGMGGGAGRGGR